MITASPTDGCGVCCPPFFLCCSHRLEGTPLSIHSIVFLYIAEGTLVSSLGLHPEPDKVQVSGFDLDVDGITWRLG